MPLGTRPGQTYEVVLSTDADLPIEKQPVFIFRYLSVEEWEEIANIDVTFTAATDPITMIDLAFQVIKRVLCDWRNMKTTSGEETPYQSNKLKSALSLPEATELMQAAIAQRPSFGDKKKFDSPSDLDTARSAKDAKGPKSAKTGPQ